MGGHQGGAGHRNPDPQQPRLRHQGQLRHLDRHQLRSDHDRGQSLTGNESGGISIELDYGATIRNNTITGNNQGLDGGFQGGGIYAFNAQDADISGNTLSGNGGGVWVYEENRGSGNQGPWITENVNVHGNTIQMAIGDNGQGGTSSSDPSVKWYDNDYTLSSSEADLILGGREVSIAEWQASGRDTAASGSTFNGASPPPPPPPPPPEQPPTATVGSGPDVLRLEVSQDAYRGSAEYRVLVDGQQIGGKLTASAAHSGPGVDLVDVRGNWAPGSHTATVQFLNDLYYNSPTGDRNLYVEDAAYNGVDLPDPANGGNVTWRGLNIAFTDSSPIA